MDKAQALYQFWSGFGLPAYDETDVPSDASMPRITYETATDSFNEEISLAAAIWYYSTSWKDVTLKSFEISRYIGMGGKIIRTDHGAMWIKRGTPFAQRIDDSNDSVKRIALNVSVEFFEQD